MVKEINHVSITTSDIETTVRFYMDILDARVVREGFIPNVRTRSVYLQVANGLIELLCKEDNEGEVKGLGHTAFLTDDLDKEYEFLKEQGSFYVLPKVAGTGVGRLSFMKGPNNENLEIMQRDDSFRQPPVKMKNAIISEFENIRIQATDLEKSIHFYEKAFGYPLIKRCSAENQEWEMAYVGTDIDTICLIHTPDTTSSGPQIECITFRVDDIHAMQDRLEKHQVELLKDYPIQPNLGGGNIIRFKDPDGVVIEVVDRKNIRNV